MFDVKVDLTKTFMLCDRMKKQLRSVKGARAGYFIDKTYPNSDLTTEKNALMQEEGVLKGNRKKRDKTYKKAENTVKKESNNRWAKNRKAVKEAMAMQKGVLDGEKGKWAIPPRPFLTNAFKKKKEWIKYIKEQADITGETHKTLNSVMKEVAEMMKNAIKDSIDSNTPPPNSPVTVALKKSSRTLIDTGILRNSVNREVIKK